MCANTGFFLDGFKALQLEDTTAHDAFSLRLALVYLLVVWAPFFWLSSAISFVAYIFTFLSLAHVLHGALLYFFLLFLLRRARPTRLFMVPLFVCRALSFSVPCPSCSNAAKLAGELLDHIALTPEFLQPWKLLIQPWNPLTLKFFHPNYQQWIYQFYSNYSWSIVQEFTV